MRRCGDCKNFLPQNTNSAADDGTCMAILEDGIGIEVGIYQDAAKCSSFEELDRVRTNMEEFTWDPLLRSARGFDEK